MVAELLMETELLSDTLVRTVFNMQFDINNKILFLCYEYGTTCPKILISKLGIKKSNLTSAINYLSEHKLIVRSKSQTDKRQIMFKLTQQGEKNIKSIIERFENKLKSWENIDVLKNALQEISNIYNRKV